MTNEANINNVTATPVPAFGLWARVVDGGLEFAPMKLDGSADVEQWHEAEYTERPLDAALREIWSDRIEWDTVKITDEEAEIIGPSVNKIPITEVRAALEAVGYRPDDIISTEIRPVGSPLAAVVVVVFREAGEERIVNLHENKRICEVETGEWRDPVSLEILDPETGDVRELDDPFEPTPAEELHHPPAKSTEDPISASIREDRERLLDVTIRLLGWTKIKIAADDPFAERFSLAEHPDAIEILAGILEDVFRPTVVEDVERIPAVARIIERAVAVANSTIELCDAAEEIRS